MTRLAGVLAVIAGLLAGSVSTAGATIPPNAFSATAGVVFSGTVGGFHLHCDTGCNGLNQNATIDWGDGTKPPSSVMADETCIPNTNCTEADFSISGTHRYRLPGTYAASFKSVLDGAVDVPVSATVSDMIAPWLKPAR